MNNQSAVGLNKICSTAFTLFILLLHGPLACLAQSTAQDFKTPEYLASTGLEHLQAAEAYALGFTGKGVIIGIIDNGFAPGVNEFEGKYAFDAADTVGGNEHGIHVAGLLVARKNDLGMHGTAFDAQLLPYLLNARGTLSGWLLMLEHPEVRIINNSWSTKLFSQDDDFILYMLDDNRFSAEDWQNWVQHLGDLVTLANALAAQDKLVIMGAANDGHLSPGLVAALPTLLDWADEENLISNNWLSVAAYNPAYASTHPAFIPVFTNLGLHAEEYTLLAPGVNIYSTVSSDTYANNSGTSMATPYVSGVAALVQQAFPYLGGKQLADTLLSTATPLDQSSWPKFLVLARVLTVHADGTPVAQQLSVYSTGQITATEDEINAIIKGMNLSTPEEEERVHALILERIAAPNILTSAEYAALFGQGIVNAYRAVQGPGYFNANRLDPVLDLSQGVYGGDYALYSVDTQGFASIWSNDIGQRVGSSGNALDGLDVGLRKSGHGLLYLAGANTYAGPTVITGGGVSLGKSGYVGQASLAGNVFVEQDGQFAGNGLVQGNISSSGLLITGLADESGTCLTVEGTVESSGTTRFVLGQDGLANSLRADGAMNLSGALEVSGTTGGVIRPYLDYAEVAQSAVSLSVSQLESITLSPFLSFTPLLDSEGKSLSLFSNTKALDSLTGVARQTQAVAAALQQMFCNLEGSQLQRELDFLYSQSRDNFLLTAVTMRGDIQASTLTALPLGNGLLRRMLPETSQAGTRQANQDVPGANRLLWLRPVAQYTAFGEDASIGQAASSTNMRGLVMGLEMNGGEYQVGALLGFGNSEHKQAGDWAGITDLRVGVYSRLSSGGFSLQGVLSAGWQSYALERRLSTQQGRICLNSEFNGASASLGLVAAWDLLHKLDPLLRLAPYAAFDLDYVHQAGRQETGHDVFALTVDSRHLLRSFASVGLSLDFAPQERFSFALSSGYKRLLNGYRPELNAGFAADPSSSFTVISTDEARNYITYDLKVEISALSNLKLSAVFSGESSSRSRQYSGFLGINYFW